MKKNGDGLMPTSQYLGIAKYLADVAPCNLLVFGLGGDSRLWDFMNKGANTCFLEDDQEWIEKMGKGLNVFSVEYKTKVEEWESTSYDDPILNLDLSPQLRSINWDFIIVDAPLGHQPPRPFNGPGRMSSIFESHRLIRDGGIVVIDDMGRECEKTSSYHYFGKNNLVELIENKVGVFKK